MWAIYKREMRSYFTSAIGYIYIATFMAVSGFLFSLYTLQAGAAADIASYFTILLFMFIIVVPLLTMKLFSEERKMKTEQLLLTAPITLWSMVFAKFLAAYTMFAGTYLISCTNYISLYKFGTPNTAILIGNSFGLLFLGAAFIAIGLFISAMTENQLVAAISTMGIILLLVIIGFLNNYIDFLPIRMVLDWISIFSRYSDFTYGIFNFASLFYYLSFVVIFLFLTVRIYERRRWN